MSARQRARRLVHARLVVDRVCRPSGGRRFLSAFSALVLTKTSDAESNKGPRRTRVGSTLKIMSALQLSLLGVSSEVRWRVGAGSSDPGPAFGPTLARFDFADGHRRALAEPARRRLVLGAVERAQPRALGALHERLSADARAHRQ